MKYFLGLLTGIFLMVIKDWSIPILHRRKQDKQYHKNNLLEKLYSPLFAITSNFTVKNIIPLDNKEIKEYAEKKVSEIFHFKFNIFVLISIFALKIPIIKKSKYLKGYLISEIFFGRIDTLIKSYNISYSKNACSQILNLIKNNLSICDDKLLEIYMSLKNEYEETIAYADSVTMVKYLSDKKPELFKKDDDEAIKLIKKEMKLFLSRNLLEECKKNVKLKEIRDSYIEHFKKKEQELMFKIWIHVLFMFKRLRGELDFSKEWFKALNKV